MGSMTLKVQGKKLLSMNEVSISCFQPDHFTDKELGMSLDGGSENSPELRFNKSIEVKGNAQCIFIRGCG